MIRRLPALNTPAEPKTSEDLIGSSKIQFLKFFFCQIQWKLCGSGCSGTELTPVSMHSHHIEINQILLFPTWGSISRGERDFLLCF